MNTLEYPQIRVCCYKESSSSAGLGCVNNKSKWWIHIVRWDSVLSFLSPWWVNRGASSMNYCLSTVLQKQMTHTVSVPDQIYQYEIQIFMLWFVFVKWYRTKNVLITVSGKKKCCLNKVIWFILKIVRCWVLSFMHLCMLLVLYLSSEPGRESSRVGASEADPGVPVAQIEAVADVLVECSQVSKAEWKGHTKIKSTCI